MFLVVGLGVIGTTYGLVFKQAGHNVEHYIREGSRKRNIKRLSVSLLDGRKTTKGIETTSEYTVLTCSKRAYDMIVISITQGKIADVMQEIKHAGIAGTVLLCCNIWYDKQQLHEMMTGYHYVLGFPVAGGSLRKGDTEEDMKLDACLFNHFMLEREDHTTIPNYQNIYQLFTSCNIKLEHPHDMLEWTWIHMAVNAAVISVAGKHGDITNSSEAARRLMNSVSLLKNVIKVIRETTKIVASRGCYIVKILQRTVVLQGTCLSFCPLHETYVCPKPTHKKNHGAAWRHLRPALHLQQCLPNRHNCPRSCTPFLFLYG